MKSPKGIDLESLALSNHSELLELIARPPVEQTLTLDEMKKAFSNDRSPNNTFQQRPRSAVLIVPGLPFVAPLNVSVGRLRLMRGEKSRNAYDYLY